MDDSKPSSSEAPPATPPPTPHVHIEPAGSREESARGQQDPAAAAEKGKQQQKPAFRFPQGDWSSQQQYYAQVPFQGNPFVGKGPGGPSAPLYDPLVLGPVPPVFVAPGYVPLPGARSGVWDPEAGAWQPIYGPLFTDSETRMGFVEKTLGLMLLQLLITVGASALFRYWEPARVAVDDHAWIFFLLWAISFVCVMTLSSNERMRRVHPYNYITFIIFTISFSLIVGILTAFFDTQLLLMALGITAAAVAFMFIIAAATGFDFTQAGGLLYIMGFVFVIMIFVGVFVPSNVYFLIISAIAAVLFSAYLLYDLQAIMGGRAVELSPDDYVYAAVQVYLDVVLLFVSLLNILALAQPGGS
ncbi:hypothetical protein WJX75_005780 [Coccomyxa subellipsoidea]|uniref:Uncharacterized protein n=1 Tax=Coccomyxa subellipsoidea TaxID=248742 RepID=A0ABR2Z5B1_9CHLO